MAKYIRAVRLPEGDLVSLEAIVTVKRFDGGVGLLDLRNRMIGWIDIDLKESDSVRAELFARTLTIFDEMINDRRRASQPDWSYLTATTVPPTKSNPTPAPAAK